MSPSNLVAWFGRLVITLFVELGGAILLALRCLKAIFTPRMEWRETLRQSGSFGVGSILVLAATAALVGGILVVQAGLYVRRFGVQELVGWFVGYGVLREVGPLVAGLVFSGRVGSRNAAEIAAMVTRDQFEGLRSIGIDVVPVVIAPRAVAMAFSLVSLYFLGAIISIGTAALAAYVLLSIDGWQFERSFELRTHLDDLWTGVAKSIAFAIAVALISCRAGMTARGGATAVGDAAKQSVVRAAFAIVVLDLCVARLLS
jgi:phospholipid/cholesterol/gamma-HCH transport system permease protein